ncbi:hypothetical protein [Flavobacterium sp.]|uniref:hypothetical protein n=1 Tax=Flavobacterium sp. TaxID=239 RepID=UPI002FD8A804
MPPILRLILAIIAGIFIGSSVNMGLIMLSGSVIPPPEGIDVSTAEGLKQALPLFEPKHFIFPFLAHALGTLCGALVAALLCPKAAGKGAFIVGLFFFLGGIANVFLFSAPTWFIATDLILAYFPMAYLGYKWAPKK